MGQTNRDGIEIRLGDTWIDNNGLRCRVVGFFKSKIVAVLIDTYQPFICLGSNIAFNKLVRRQGEPEDRDYDKYEYVDFPKNTIRSNMRKLETLIDEIWVESSVFTHDSLPRHYCYRYLKKSEHPSVELPTYHEDPVVNLICHAYRLTRYNRIPFDKFRDEMVNYHIQHEMYREEEKRLNRQKELNND